MQIIAGQNVSPNSMPGPTGFGFGSGHNPNAAAVMMNNSGVAPTTSKTRPTLTQVDLRYWLMADCGLTVKLRRHTEAPDWSCGCTLSSRTRGDTTALHGPLQRLLDGGIVDGEPPRPSTYVRADGSHNHVRITLTRSSMVKVTLARGANKIR